MEKDSFKTINPEDKFLSWEEKTTYYGAIQEELLQKIEETKTFPKKYLSNQDPIIRHIAVHVFGLSCLKEKGRYQEIGIITPLLLDEDDRVREKALAVVLRNGLDFDTDNKNLSLLAQKALEDPAFNVRAATLGILTGKLMFNDSFERENYLQVLENGLVHSDEKTRVEAVNLFYEYLDFYEDPLEKIKEILKDESKEVRAAAASPLAMILPIKLGPEKILEEFSAYSIKEFPEVHGAITYMGLTCKEFLRNNEAYKKHLVRIVSETNDRFTGSSVLWIVMKRLSPYDPYMIKVISAALENDNEEIRVGGQFYYDMFIKWHKENKNTSQ